MILVTGGAGYVGSVVAQDLLQQGHEVLVLDNLLQGHRQAVPVRADFVEADLRNADVLEKVFAQFRIDGVMHMAAETVVEYSMTDPKRYFTNNVIGGLNLLEAMLRQGVERFIFSSSAAVYGEPRSVPIDEHHTKAPVNAYGESKLMFERVLEWYGRAYGLKYVSLRYFNAGGATKDLGEDHRPETHLIPIVLKAALGTSVVPIFGTDYPTEDGSCVRDFVHVKDIAQAHVLALGRLDAFSGHAYNLGNSTGFSVRQVVDVARRITGRGIPTSVQPRRAGDPVALVASSSRAKTDLGWQPQFPGLDSIIESAWRWAREHPEGYLE